jgi:hypothetical protein
VVFFWRTGSFLWLNEDIELSALVQTTNVNVTQVRDPPYAVGPLAPPSPPFPSSSCTKPLRGKDALLVASGLDGWKGVLPAFGQCCAKCETVGLAACHGWFYRADTKECFLKPHASKDSVTTPLDVFYGGRSAIVRKSIEEEMAAQALRSNIPMNGLVSAGNNDVKPILAKRPGKKNPYAKRPPPSQGDQLDYSKNDEFSAGLTLFSLTSTAPAFGRDNLAAPPLATDADFVGVDGS